MEEHVIQKYKSREGATSYNTKYDEELHKRLNNKVEFALIRKCFDIVGPQDRMLDLPSGTGRLTPVFQPYAKRWVESDVSREMLKYCRENTKAAAEGYVQASAFHLPYKDGAFDCVFSARLTHHIPEDRERDQFIRELGRIAKKWVVMTYFHKWSLKNLLRMLRRPFNRKKAKVVMSTAEFRAVADTAGLEVVHSFPLSRLFSGHHYAILRKRG